MKLSDVKDIAMIGAIALAVYAVYKLLQKGRDAGESVMDFIAEPIASFWTDDIAENTNVANAVIQLPDGLQLNVNQVALKKTAGREQYTFTYMGTRYELLPRSGNVYPARALP